MLLSLYTNLQIKTSKSQRIKHNSVYLPEGHLFCENTLKSHCSKYCKQVLAAW